MGCALSLQGYHCLQASPTYVLGATVAANFITARVTLHFILPFRLLVFGTFKLEYICVCMCYVLISALLVLGCGTRE